MRRGEDGVWDWGLFEGVIFVALLCWWGGLARKGKAEGGADGLVYAWDVCRGRAS